MPARRNRPGKHGTAPSQATDPHKGKRQRAYETSLKEACARWLWEAERRRPDSLHGVPLVHVDGARLLAEAGRVELDDHDGLACRLKPTFKTWWCGYGTSTPSELTA